MLNIEHNFQEIYKGWAKNLMKIKKDLRRFWGSDLDLFKKVEPHLKIEPSYKKMSVLFQTS